MDVLITKIEPQPLEESSGVIKLESIDITTTTTSNSVNDGIIERIEPPYPLLSQSERNMRQMVDDESLIYSVQKFPIIYDRTNPNYQNKEQVRYIWSVIAENLGRSPDYCHKRWRYLRDYFVRQLRYHRSTTDPNKLKRPWVLFNKLTFLQPFVAHVVDKNNFESYSEATNGLPSDKHALDYSYKYQSENYYECDGTEGADGNEIHDLTIDETMDDEEPNHGFPSNGKKRKGISLNSSGYPNSSIDHKIMETEKRLDEHDHFLFSLAPELRKIDPKFTLHFRNEVHNLIMKYQSMSPNGK